MSTNLFTLLYKTQSNDVPVSKHGCSLVLDSNNDYLIYTFYGSQDENDTPYCGIYLFNLSDSNVKPKVLSNGTTNMLCRTSSAYGFINNSLLIIGGQNNQVLALNDIWQIDLNSFSEKLLGSMKDSIYSSTFLTTGNTVFLYSGSSQSGYSLYSTPTNTFYAFQIVGLSNNFCGDGMYYNPIFMGCFYCPSGTYSDARKNLCITCLPGTYNSLIGASHITQCIPCPYGTYSYNPKTTECITCSIPENCPVGSTFVYPLDYQNYFPNGTQPPNYSPSQKNFIFYLGIVFLILFVIYATLFYFVRKFRVLISAYEIYPEKHVKLLEDVKNKIIRAGDSIPESLYDDDPSIIVDETPLNK